MKKLKLKKKYQKLKQLEEQSLSIAEMKRISDQAVKLNLMQKVELEKLKRKELLDELNSEF